MRQPVTIKTKDKQSNAATKSDLLQSVNPVTSSINLAKIKHIRDGGILVSCSSKDAAEKFSKEAKVKLADKYSITEAKTLNPRIRVAGMSEHHDEDTL